MKKTRIVCPYCHILQEADIAFEMVFENIAITFKCDGCKKQVRIYVKTEGYGEMVKEWYFHIKKKSSKKSSMN